MRICANIEPHAAGRDSSTMADLLRFHRYIEENPRKSEKELVADGILPSGFGRLYKWKNVITEVHHKMLTVSYPERRKLMKHYTRDSLDKSISQIQNAAGGYKIGGNKEFCDRYPVAQIWDTTPPPNMRQD